MTSSRSGFRLVAALLLMSLTLTFVAPARAEALEPMVIVAIAGAAVVVLVLIVYLVAVNARTGRRSAAGPPVYVACVQSASVPSPCWQPVAMVADVTVGPVAMQSP